MMNGPEPKELRRALSHPRDLMRERRGFVLDAIF